MLDHSVEAKPPIAYEMLHGFVGADAGADQSPAYIEAPVEKSEARWSASERQPHMFVAIFGTWLLSLVWFGPRLAELVMSFDGLATRVMLAYFAVFSTIAWLYGLYNVGVVGFSFYYRRWLSNPVGPQNTRTPPVAVLYTCCNDFVEASIASCLNIAYPSYKLYILDDSSDPAIKAQVDAFAARNSAMVRVIRRADRAGFKAGNLNNALRHHGGEPYFAVIDADEIVPADFLSKLVPYLNLDPDCGFVQANHRCADISETRLQEDMRIGIDVHWKWYQSLRNKFGFVMFLGHGALLRRSCWDKVGGFQEIVSEDLAYAISIRELGYYGVFAENVTCTEAFPDTVRAFRVRHVKWTRGTCEFLSHWALKLLRSKRIPWIEKLDILFPTANLPLTFFFFIFMLLGGIALPLQIGEWRALTLELGGQPVVFPTLAMPLEMNILYTWDFFAITVLTLFAPILCFIIEHWRTPVKLFRFLAHSTALYAALNPLTALCVLGYMLTGKARFLVTGDKSDVEQVAKTPGRGLYKFFCETLPDSRGVRSFEITAGLLFLAVSVVTFQIAFFGLAIGFILHPLLGRGSWSNGWLRRTGFAPFTLILLSVALGGSSFFAVQPMLFGFGFHF